MSDFIDRFTTWFSEATDYIFPYLQSFWALFNDYAYMRAALIAAVSYFIAKIFSHYIPLGIAKLITRLNLNFGNSFGNEIAPLIRFPLFYLTLLFGLVIANQAADSSEQVEFAFTAIFQSLIVVVIAISVYRGLHWALIRTANSADETHIVQTQTLPLFTNTTLVFIAFAAIHQVFAAWHVDMTALLASAGIAGMAIGMAAKDMISDVIAGVMIMTDNPYKVGDVVLIDDVIADESTRGTVSHIGLRSTRMITRDNIQVIIPNSRMSNDSVINESSAADSGVRIQLEVRTAYGIDPNIIRNLLLDACKDNKSILPEADKKVALAKFTEKYAIYHLMVWISDPMTRVLILAELREAVYIRFIQEQISIALPDDRLITLTELPLSTQEVFIKEMPLSKQEVVIKEMPDSKRTIHVKEIPNLFGNGGAKAIGKNNINSKNKVTAMPTNSKKPATKEARENDA